MQQLIKSKFLPIIILVGLSLVGFVIRMVGQPEIPYGFHRDEAGIAYSAYSVLKTGHDEWGRFMPLHFKALGDYPPGGYNYLVAMSISVFGLNEFAERFPAILLGTAMIPLSYFFVKLIFKRIDVALVTASLVTFSSWQIVQSRAASEALTGLFFVLLGIVMLELWRDVKEKQLIKSFLLAGGTISVLFSMIHYNALKLGVPLLLFAYLYLSWPQLKKQSKKVLLGLVLLVWLVGFGMVFSSTGRLMSFNNTSVFTQDMSQQFAVNFIREGIFEIPVLFSRIYTNKLSQSALALVENYFGYFSYNFLFNDEGFHKRYMVPKIGPMLLWLLPLILAGIFAFRNQFASKRLYWFLLFWIFLAPFPAAITAIDEPNLKRAVLLFFPLIIFAAHGIIGFVSIFRNSFQKIVASIIIGLIATLNLGYFAKQYFVHTAYETVHSRSYGYSQIYEFTESVKDQYESIIVYEGGDSPHIFYLFYTNFPPLEYQAIPDDQKRNLFSSDKKPVTIREYTFSQLKCPIAEDLEVNHLIVFAEGCLNDDELSEVVQVLETVFDPGLMPLFSIVTLKNLPL